MLPGELRCRPAPQPSWARAPSAPGSGPEERGEEPAWPLGAALDRGTAASSTHWEAGSGGFSRLQLGLPGHPYQPLAKHPQLLVLNQIFEIAALQELGHTKQRFPGGLESSRA